MTKLAELRKKNLEMAKKAVRQSVNSDLFIINAVNNLDELQKIINTLSKRLREWYSLYFPELDKKIPDHEGFVKLVLKTDKKELQKELKLTDEMGFDLEKKDLEPILSLASVISDLSRETKLLEEYLEKTMKTYCSNLLAMTGALIGAKLLSEAGSLRKMAMMRSSTIQLLGAEKALFRHIKTGSKPPKYGYLLQHQLVQRAKSKDRGRIARALADKIFLAVRVDYFKGTFVGEKLLKELEAKFK